MSKAKVYFWGASLRKEERGINILEPQLVKGVTNPIQVAIGGNFIVILSEDGKVSTFGEGSGGRLGHGNNDDQKTPKVIDSLTSKKIVFIHAGDWHGGAIDDAGCVYVWGRHVKDSASPEYVPLPEKAKYLQCGHQYTAIITESNSLYIFGKNDSGKCGKPKTEKDVSAPYKFSLKELGFADESDTFADVSCGYATTVVVTLDTGRVYSFGNNETYQCGIGGKPSTCVKPTRVPLPESKRFVSASCSVGSSHHCHSGAVTDQGEVYMWGSGYKDKLGNSSSEDQPLPIHIKFFNENNIIVKKLVCGGIHSQVLATDDSIYSFGCGSDGRLGHPECEGHRYLYKEKNPRLIEPLKGKVAQVSSGYYHVVALTK